MHPSFHWRSGNELFATFCHVEFADIRNGNLESEFFGTSCLWSRDQLSTPTFVPTSAVFKTLVGCFIYRIILPTYMGIVINQYKDLGTWTNQDFMVHVSQVFCCCSSHGMSAMKESLFFEAARMGLFRFTNFSPGSLLRNLRCRFAKILGMATWFQCV